MAKKKYFAGDKKTSDAMRYFFGMGTMSPAEAYQYGQKMKKKRLQKGETVITNYPAKTGK